ncbi:DUF2683 family protein [Mucilaginibacter sp.]|jgi:hypothetical protein|uniref:DUF2683 family protein n=1 Tax=Mucilaginibacter sp. TaxID=1882438 RepID=UPI00356911DF
MTYAVHPTNEAQEKAVKAVLDAMQIPYEEEPDVEKPYDPLFMAKIDESRKQAREGKGTIIKTEDLWK